MKKIYGNEKLISTLDSINRRGKNPHSVIFYGEKGCGKKLIADYCSRMIMCESPDNGKPCGVCSACVNISKGFHPDVMRVERTGKTEGYSVKTARSVINDAYVKPNNSSGKKVYIFADCQNMDVRTQNAMLKIIEEPPDYAYFIFTCTSKTVFLPTIISRCVSFAVCPCSEEETRSALRECNYENSAIDAAVSCFHGNIGMCERYITDEKLRRQVDLTKSLADSIIRGDEYRLNVDFFSLGRERNDINSVLSMLDLLVRDAAVLENDSSARTIGCFREGAVSLSRNITAWQAARLHRQIENAWNAIEANAAPPLVLAALCAEIIEIVH